MTIMKNFLLLVLCIAPLAMIAQMPNSAVQKKSTVQKKSVVQQKSPYKSKTTSTEMSKAYGQLIVTTSVSGETSIKVDFGSALMEMSQDIFLSREIATIQSYKPTNLPDALNTLSSLGWELEMSYPTETRVGAYNTFIFSKDGLSLNAKKLRQDKGMPPKPVKSKR